MFCCNMVKHVSEVPQAFAGEPQCFLLVCYTTLHLSSTESKRAAVSALSWCARVVPGAFGGLLELWQS